MKILLPVDGSAFTKKALAFVTTHENFAGPQDELVVMHVQPPVPPRVKTMLGAQAIYDYHNEEAHKVLDPIERFLKRHDVRFRLKWVVGSPSRELVRAAKAEKVHMIVMGTHGHGVVARALMGSVAQSVVTDAEVPVLLVK